MKNFKEYISENNNNNNDPYYGLDTKTYQADSGHQIFFGDNYIELIEHNHQKRWLESHRCF